MLIIQLTCLLAAFVSVFLAGLVYYVVSEDKRAKETEAEIAARLRARQSKPRLHSVNGKQVN